MIALTIALNGSPAQIELPDVQVEVACDTLPGPQVATCRTCDENTGILPHTCLLLYSFSEAEDSATKEVSINQEKLAAMFLMLLLVAMGCDRYQYKVSPCAASTQVMRMRRPS